MVFLVCPSDEANTMYVGEKGFHHRKWGVRKGKSAIQRKQHSRYFMFCGSKPATLILSCSHINLEMKTLKVHLV